MIPQMTAVVTLDKAGRIVIPKETRRSRRLRPGTKFLLVEGRDGRIWLQRLDAEELARQIREELKGVDLDPLIAKVEAEAKALAKDKYPSVTRR